jgi:N-acetyl-anhydromuramyl-L-alanine amidase AmpD
VGRTSKEGIDQWVSLEDRSWHAGRGQVLTDKHLPVGTETATRTHVGIEVAGRGFSDAPASGRAPEAGMVLAAGDGGDLRWWYPYPAEQAALVAEAVRGVLLRWPHIRPEDHCGHSDLCPDRKEDPGPLYPYAEIVRLAHGLDEERWPDTWAPFRTVEARQRCLRLLGHDPGPADGRWGPRSAEALSAWLVSRGRAAVPAWTTWAARAALHEVAAIQGSFPAAVRAVLGG